MQGLSRRQSSRRELRPLSECPVHGGNQFSPRYAAGSPSASTTILRCPAVRGPLFWTAKVSATTQLRRCSPCCPHGMSPIPRSPSPALSKVRCQLTRKKSSRVSSTDRYLLHP